MNSLRQTVPALAALLSFAGPVPLLAQGADCSFSNLEVCATLIGLDSVQTNRLKEELVGLLEDPETLNKALSLIIQDGNLLGDLRLRFKTFHVDTGTALGLTYGYAKDIARTRWGPERVTHTGFTFEFDSRGNVSFDSNLRPRDFLNATLSMYYFRSSGGVASTTSPATQLRLAEAIDSLAKLSTAELAISELDRETFGLISGLLSTQFYVNVGVAGTFETNQGFDENQYAGGAQLGLDLKAWNRSSTLARLNVFDWPFALLRYLSGIDREITPRGSSIPTVIAAFMLVDPVENPAREVLDQLEAYPRLNFEAAYRTLTLQARSVQLFFEADFRFYQEIGASPEIKAADLDSFVYFAAALTASNGMYASFSTGQLPFDARRDQVYELGFKFEL